MAKPYSITITNGTGSEEILNGQYVVTASSTGYDDTTILPSTLDVVDGTNTYDFTIAATGTLTLHVTEEGTSTGTIVEGAKFIRCDSLGNTYGSEIVTDNLGNAIFNNVPYSATNAPKIYFKQTESDGSHEFSSDLQEIELTTETYTSEIVNAKGAMRTINLTDANYLGLPIDGMINLG